jgi:hypothetical protein
MNKAVAYLLAMEWSRSLTYLDDHSFRLKGSSGEEYSFQVLECTADGMTINLPKPSLETDYVILLITNKLGDNCVTTYYYPLTESFNNGFIDAKDLVEHIIFKIRMEVETNISPDSNSILHEGKEQA